MRRERADDAEGQGGHGQPGAGGDDQIASWGLPLAAELGLVTFAVPLPLPPLHMGLAWHPRHDADPAHAWLRGCVRDLARDWQVGAGAGPAPTGRP
ncbi:hypothetical protein GCM10010448_13010 [Streptomyces glomeratus]|uniref:LysR substrate-binding domain-containing protein n=1 Tax=Streptomyces glomeratus TaxID=284452 RepID=A0ABP6L612_9ACTN